MNPIMWMSQYNPERLEDATSFYGQSAVLSIMDDLPHQTTMEMNPMMSIVGGEFNGQMAAAQAAAAAALGVQSTGGTTLIAANAADVYGLTQGVGIHQVLQHPVFANYTEMIDDTTDGMVEHDDSTQYVTQVYDENSCFGNDIGIAGGVDGGLIEPKQEIITMDDYGMQVGSGGDNPYDDMGDMGSNSSDGGGGGMSVMKSSHKGMVRAKKTRKIEPVNRPGLELKTPIAYKGNTDPSVIPIERDGMAVCVRCGAIGVKHTFYTKARRFCSMQCARRQMFAIIHQNNKTTPSSTSSKSGNSGNNNPGSGSGNTIMAADGKKRSPTDLELELRVAQIKNYRFKVDSGENGENESTILDDSLEDSRNAVLFRDVVPIDELPQIPKSDRLPSPCLQDETIRSIRRRAYDPLHSFDWTPELSKPNFFAAPVTCFPHAPGYEMWDNIGVSMKVEVENTDVDSQSMVQPGQTPHSFWVATVLNICGYKALMRYEGFDEPSHDFWVNLCSSEVHPVGWCATRGKPLIPPKSIEQKYKDWKDFLVERLSGARTLPSSFYNKISDSFLSRFRVGLNLECVDKDLISQVRLATVQKIVGKRLFVKYFDSDDGFWCHEDSQIIHPVGWATTVGHNLAAPQDYLQRMLAGREQMIEVHEDDATIELFKMNFTFEEYYLEGQTMGFMEGMKLEAIDPLNLSAICAATVCSVLKFGYILIRIDSYSEDSNGSDWFCYHEKSPSIFPVGFCHANDINLTPPIGYDPQTFDWDRYLEETGHIAAPEDLFHHIIPNHGFQVGMRLECADLMDPKLICVARIARIVGRLIRIRFDGWGEEYDQWLDCESADFYPVGWSLLVGHKLEGPPPQVQPVKITPKAKPKLKRGRKKLTKTDAPKSIHLKKESSYEVYDQSKNLNTVQRVNIKHEPILKMEEEHDLDDDDEEDYEDSINSSSTATVYSDSRNALVNQQILAASPANSSSSIPKNTNNTTSQQKQQQTQATEDLSPSSWTCEDVCEFLSLNDCQAHRETFSQKKVDGERLMQLTKDEIINLLGMKVGPALKIFDLIQQLKNKMNPSKTRLLKTNSNSNL